jgi:hypothetical protein
MDWYVDEGLQQLDREWKAVHPGATVYHIGDIHHDTNPDVSQHAPDRGGSQAGDDKGEVDGSDFMPGNGVTEEDLDDLAEGLRKSRDPRLLIVIRRNRIFSSVIQPFVWRPYSGKYHGHTHVSVNDRYDNNPANWNWEDEVARTYTMRQIPGEFPELRSGDEDQPGKVQYIKRIQSVLNGVFGEELDLDGVYGAGTAAAVKRMMASDTSRSSTNGAKFYVPEAKRLFGIW